MQIQQIYTKKQHTRAWIYSDGGGGRSHWSTKKINKNVAWMKGVFGNSRYIKHNDITSKTQHEWATHASQDSWFQSITRARGFIIPQTSIAQPAIQVFPWRRLPCAAHNACNSTFCSPHGTLWRPYLFPRRPEALALVVAVSFLVVAFMPSFLLMALLSIFLKATTAHQVGIPFPLINFVSISIKAPSYSIEISLAVPDGKV